jgi:prevent-host-death family protein
MNPDMSPVLTAEDYGHIIMVMKKKDYEIAAGRFKAGCLSLMDRVAETGAEYVITKHGKPVARLGPIRKSAKRSSVFGCMKGTSRILGDIVSPLNVTWEANEGR